MYPQFFNNQVPSGDQMQSTPMQRSDPRFRQEGTRAPQLQNPYSAVSMGANVPGQQMDPRFLGAMNPGISSNSSIPYNMMPNAYAESLKTMQMPYDRGLFHYSMPMQMMDMQANGYAAVNPYYSYYGMRPGMPLTPMERTMVSGYPTDYSMVSNQSRVAQPPLSTTTPKSQLPAMSTKGNDIAKHAEAEPSSEKAASEPPKKTESVPAGISDTSKEVPSVASKDTSDDSAKDVSKDSIKSTPSSDASLEMQVANMLLQMKGKSREAFSQPKPPLLYTDDKRPRTDGFHPTKSMCPLPYTPSQHPPPIPPPSLQSKPTAPIGDCFVYCTVCRHGTPISLNKPIPDTFACSNCGFTCVLDKHLLSYYNFSIPQTVKEEPREEKKDPAVLDSLILPALEGGRAETELAALAAREDLTGDDAKGLLEQCRSASRDWWVGKFVKVEIPEKWMLQNDVLGVKKEKEEGEAMKMAVAEVVGMSETGFALRIVGEKEQNTLSIDSLVSGEYKCWLLLKEGFFNLPLF